MAEKERRFLTASQLAEIFQISRDEVYKLAKRRAIPANKIGGVWRFELAKVMESTERKENGLDT